MREKENMDKESNEGENEEHKEEKLTAKHEIRRKKTTNYKRKESKMNKLKTERSCRSKKVV